MVDESVSRRPRRSRVALGALALLTLSFASPVAADEDNAPLVIDLDSGAAKQRATRRARVTAALGQHPVLSASVDDELNAALIGELPLAAVSRGTEAAEAAHTAAVAGRCVEAMASAQFALLDLAAAQAAGNVLDAPIRLGYSARLRCQLAGGDQAAAMTTAQTLRRLGQRDAPDGIDAEAWALLPELDAAANVTMAEVKIASEPDGATIWIDHVARGVAPLTLHLSQGSHLVAAARGNSVASRTIEITSWSHSEKLAPTPSVGRWSKVAELVTSLRTARRGADAAAIGEIIALAGASSALVLLPGGTTEVWRVLGERTVRVGQRRSEAQAVALLGVGAKGSRAPDPNLPLLRETAAERAARAEKAKQKPKWWVYAAVIGAAAVGAGVIVFGQSGTDRQRFEITLP